MAAGPPAPHGSLRWNFLGVAAAVYWVFEGPGQCQPDDRHASFVSWRGTARRDIPLSAGPDRVIRGWNPSGHRRGRWAGGSWAPDPGLSGCSVPRKIRTQADGGPPRGAGL